MKNPTLPKGYLVKMSEAGHNDFFYPSTDMETLLIETVYERMAYVGSNTYAAVKIPRTAVYANALGSEYMVVWVPRDDVHAS
jgi:hypothetical protein